MMMVRLLLFMLGKSVVRSRNGGGKGSVGVETRGQLWFLVEASRFRCTMVLLCSPVASLHGALGMEGRLVLSSGLITAGIGVV